MSLQTISPEMVIDGLRSLAKEITFSKQSYNPRENEMMWYTLAKEFWPELLYIIDEVSDRMLPSGGATFYKKK